MYTIQQLYLYIQCCDTMHAHMLDKHSMTTLDSLKIKIIAITEDSRWAQNWRWNMHSKKCGPGTLACHIPPTESTEC